MESSSNDSFLWTDVSNDSSDHSKNTNLELMETYHNEEPERGSDYEEKAFDTSEVICNDNENKVKVIHGKTKKRKCLDATLESSDYSQPERKKIKLEPESDIDVDKKSKLDQLKNINTNDTKNCVLYDEEYLNLRVKEEQKSMVQSKKKKKRKRSNSSTNNICESDSTVEKNRENYLDWRVKQEQASEVDSEVMKSKSKKKHRRSSVNTEIDNKSVINPGTVLGETNVYDSSSAGGEQTEYSIIEDKFTAEETEVQKPKKKKKHKKDGVPHEKIDNDIKSISIMKQIETTSEIDNENSTLEPSDFTCNNIVSSTIINSSSIDLKENEFNQNKEVLKRSKNDNPTKISDRIRFEDDNLIQQESFCGITTDKINMFLKANPHLKLCSSEMVKESPNSITDQDEIWTLTWPNKINLEKLRNTTLSFDGKCKIKIDGQTYDGTRNEDAVTITLLTYESGEACITSLPVNDCMNFYKRIPKVHIPDNNIMVNNQTNFTPLPETKCRHPLFGAHYKKAIKIPKAVVERLQAANKQSNETSSKTNKKKKKKHKLVDIKSEENCIYVKPESEPLKEAKKRKHSLDDDDPPKKSKRAKHTTDSPAVWESEKSIEENLFNF